MTTADPIALTTRNADLTDLHRLLEDQRAHRFDVVLGNDQIRAADGHLQIIGTPPALTPEGVTSTSGQLYLPTQVCDQGLATKLGIPQAYLRRLREERPQLYDANINGWLDGADRRYLLRTLIGGGGEHGIARAFLSPSYKIIDNLDVLMAALDGVRQAGLPVDIDGCDLTERRMYVRVVCKQVSALAPDLLRDYRSPYSGESGADCPVVFSGFVISNSETGCGAYSITPRLVVQVCGNGMTIDADALRHVHLGGQMAEGVVRWSSDTEHKNLELITAQARDAVATFLDVDYVRAKLAELTQLARTEIGDPAKAIEVIAKKLTFTDAQQADILNHFIRGGDLSAGGVMHAVTSVAQLQSTGDLAHEMESSALRALQLAAGTTR